MNTTNTSGDSVIALGFKQKVSGDAIGDALMQEIARRLEGTVPTPDSTSDIWNEASAPTDKSLIWWPKDPITGARVGQPKTYDVATETWIVIGTGAKPSYAPRKRLNGSFQVAAGASLSNVSFADFGHDDYHITLTPHLFQGGAYITPPASTNNFAVWVANRASGAFSVQVYAAPTGGALIEWEIGDKNAETQL